MMSSRSNTNKIQEEATRRDKKYAPIWFDLLRFVWSHSLANAGNNSEKWTDTGESASHATLPNCIQQSKRPTEPIFTNQIRLHLSKLPGRSFERTQIFCRQKRTQHLHGAEEKNAHQTTHSTWTKNYKWSINKLDAHILWVSLLFCITFFGRVSMFLCTERFECILFGNR